MISRGSVLSLMLAILPAAVGFIAFQISLGWAAEWVTEDKYATEGREILTRKQIEMHKLPFPTNVTTPSDLLGGIQLSLPGAGSVGAAYETPKLVRCMYQSVKSDPFVDLGQVAKICEKRVESVGRRL